MRGVRNLLSQSTPRTTLLDTFMQWHRKSVFTGRTTNIVGHPGPMFPRSGRQGLSVYGEGSSSRVAVRGAPPLDDPLGARDRLVEKIERAKEIARVKGLSFGKAYISVLQSCGQL